MNDRGYGKTVLSLRRCHNDDQVVHAPIIHVAGAVTDTDETYGAYVAAENNTFINTSNSNSNSNGNSNSNSKSKSKSKSKSNSNSNSNSYSNSDSNSNSNSNRTKH